MNNIVRKALRVIVDQLGQLQDSCDFQIEKDLINDALVQLVRADYFDFHINPKKKYVEPKSNFKFT